MRDAKTAQVGELVVFQNCTPAEIRRVCAMADIVDVPAGRALAARGATAREFAIVMSGAAAGEDVVLGPGSFFGHAGLVERGANECSVETLVPTRLLVFGAQAFRATMDAVPSFHRCVMNDLATRVPAQSHDDRRLRAVS